MNYKFLILLFLFSIINSNNNYFKIIQFDYSNIPSGKKDFISIFESIDFYLGLLFKKNEMKDYNHYNKMYRDIAQKKLSCGINKIINFDKLALIQKDISFLIIPKLERIRKVKEFDFKTNICKDEYSIPRVVTIIFQYNNDNILEKVLSDKMNRNYLFNRFIQIIFGNVVLELHNLKRNKLISAYPQKYLYFSSYLKFKNLTGQKDDLFSENFINIGNYSYWPVMPYFNDYLMKEYSIDDSLKSSFSEITLNLLSEYPYEVAHCDLFFYKGKKCFRVDQKCMDDCSSEKYFIEYYLDEKNKRLICNLNDGNNLKNQKCSLMYGNVIYTEFMEPKKFNEYIRLNNEQKLLLLKPSPKCPTPHPKTIFFEYMDYYRDDPYYYIKNKIDVEYLELKDPNYFVIGKIDKKESYMTKYRCFIANNILTNNLPDWNYNIYWDLYPNLGRDKGVFFEYNKYQLFGKFPDEVINNYDIKIIYDKSKDKYPDDYNYLLETLLLPKEKDLINSKFKNYKHNSENIWILKPNNQNESEKYLPHIFTLKDLQDLKKDDKKYILNKYLTNPLLINSKKFSMKTFVLVTGFSPLKIYFYRDGLLTFAKNDFSLKVNYLNDTCRHISSEKNEFFCLNDNKNINTNYIYENSLFDEKCLVWNFLNFERYCKKENINYDKIIQQIKDIIIKTFISLSPDVNNEIKKMKIRDRNMFELFSFDFILDMNNKVYLIDIDKNPEMKSLHLAPVYIYDHLISDILNIVGVVPFSHEELNKTLDKNIFNYDNKIAEAVDDALCEFTRQKGVFELVFPLKENINNYKKYFSEMSEENILLWDKILKSDIIYN